MKLLNNFVSMGYAAIYSEALALGAKAGLDAAGLRQRHPRRPHGLRLLPDLLRLVLERDRERPPFTIANALKDMTYLASFAQAGGVANPIGAAVRNCFATAVATGHGESSCRRCPILSLA